MSNLAEKVDVGFGGLDDVMKSAKQKETSPSKSKTPILKADEKLKSLAEKVYQDKVALDTAELNFTQSSEQLVKAVTPTRIDMCQKEMVTSVKCPTTNGHLVGVVFSGNYKKVPASQEAQIKSILGNEFDNSFSKKYVISAKDKDKEDFEKLIYKWLAPNNGETEADIAEGVARFQSFFEVDIVIRPTETFARRHLFMSEEKRAELELCGIQQFKPSIRTR